ncbi:hypothetical protein D3C84_799680 [compost metagenome]
MLEEPLLHRRQRHRASGRTLIDRLLLATASGLGQAADGLVLEQILGAQQDPGLTRATDHLHGNDGIAAEFEEVVFQADVVDGQHVLPDRREGFFQGAAWRDVFTLLLSTVDGRQGLAVELAVGGQRQLSEEQQERWDHVVRQMLTQCPFQGFPQGRLSVDVSQQRRIGRYEVGDQLLPVDTVLRQYCQLTDRVLLQQPGFDLPQLDAETTDLDLMVDATDVLQRAVGLITGQVAGAVQALAVAGVRVRHVFFGGHARSR